MMCERDAEKNFTTTTTRNNRMLTPRLLRLSPFATGLRSAVQAAAPRRSAAVQPNLVTSSSISRRGFGGHGHADHHAPPPPSFARLPVPSAPVHEEYDLLWNDGVAPEMALDYDAPEISKWQGLAMWYARYPLLPSFSRTRLRCL